MIQNFEEFVNESIIPFVSAMHANKLAKDSTFGSTSKALKGKWVDTPERDMWCHDAEWNRYRILAVLNTKNSTLSQLKDFVKYYDKSANINDMDINTLPEYIIAVDAGKTFEILPWDKNFLRID